MTSDPTVGQIIDGRFEIQARIGEGGMGVVYRARQTPLDRVIAVKMLNASVADDPAWVQRFYNEAKACARLQHPNTIRMFDFGQAPDGRLFMTMEFLDGMSLRDAISKGPLAPQRVVKILIQCCASLAEAHSIGIIHRDIKPDNVFLLNVAGVPDFVKLLDFSVAKLLESNRMSTQAGVVFGTPQYMSPEQGRGAPLDARSDLYALGILAFEMLTGNVPYNDDNPMTVIQMHLHAQVPPLPQSIPYSVQQIVRRALEKEPSRRYQSSGEMMQHCQQVFAEVSQGGMSISAGGMPKTMIAQGPPQMPGMPPPPSAGPPLPGMPPPMHGGQMQQPMQQPMQPASAMQKTMIAQQSPFAGGMPPGQMPPGMAPPGMAPPGMAPPGMMPPGMAPPGMAPPGMMPPGMMPPGMAPPGMMPPGGAPRGMPGPQSSTPMQKTIVAMQAPQLGQMMPPGGPGGPGMMPPPGYPSPMAPPPGMPPGMQPQGAANKTVMLQTSEGVVSVARTGQPVQPVGSGAGAQGASTAFWIVSLVIGVAVGALAYVIVLQL